MRGRPSENELHRRIADLLMSPDAGRAVAGQLRAQADEGGRRAAPADRRAGSSKPRQEVACAGRGIARDTVSDGAFQDARPAEHAL
jgi:hypothetical protein